MMRPMADAPDDGTPVLVKFKDDLTAYGVTDTENTHLLPFLGISAVMCKEGTQGWRFAAPVGRGGFSDAWLIGWWPLPTE